MNRIFKILFFVIIAFNLVLAAWYVLHDDLEFTSEVARDFLLLEEIDSKKIVLIGPSSTTGLFHGPLWLYVNYPAYFVGDGNPVIVGWWWIILIGLFLILSYYIAQKLFDSKTAYLFVLMVSVYSIFHAKGLYNPHGAMFIIPAFFFFLIRYAQTHQIKYLIIHVLLAGVLIQLQMAIGIPFFILSLLYGAFTILRSKKKNHLAVYLLILAPLVNFFIFDLRHEFLLSKLVLKFLTTAGRDELNIGSMFYQRIKFMTTGVEFLRSDPGYRNLAIFVIFSIFLFLQVRGKKYRNIYYSFLYFYIGYLILSNLNAGGLLYFYLFPIFPFVFLIFSSFATSRYNRIFIIIFFTIFIFNVQNAINDIKYATDNLIGKDKDSWLFFKNAATKIFQGEENEFGYYIYSPDIVAYRSKYVMHYLQKSSPKKASYFQKKPITYLFIAPPPADNPYMKDEWWRINLLHINKQPDSIIKFENGYKIEKYTLTDEEIKVAVEPDIDPGIHFR